MSEIKQVESREIYKNKWLTLREDIILRKNGHKGIFSVIEKDDFVVVIPIDGEFIYVVEQFRYPIKERTIELPQGSWESKKNPNPLEVAKGELREETGLSAGVMTYVGYQLLANGYSNQGYHIYLATDLTQGNKCLDIEEEDLISKKILVSDFESLLYNGTIKDATTSLAYLMAKFKGFI